VTGNNYASIVFPDGSIVPVDNDMAGNPAQEAENMNGELSFLEFS
jgi:hypothetical protein